MRAALALIAAAFGGAFVASFAGADEPPAPGTVVCTAVAGTKFTNASEKAIQEHLAAGRTHVMPLYSAPDSFSSSIIICGW